MELELSTLSDIDSVASSIVEHAQDLKVWVFYGEMGVGKTTLIKAISEYYQVTDVTSSPTFSLVNVYEDGNGKEYYHFDFYRINNELEAIDIGCDEYFYSGNHCFIEWPERIPSLIPDKYLEINIKLGVDKVRKIRLSRHD